jgi:hypothetical protein
MIRRNINAHTSTRQTPKVAIILKLQGQGHNSCEVWKPLVSLTIQVIKPIFRYVGIKRTEQICQYTVLQVTVSMHASVTTCRSLGLTKWDLPYIKYKKLDHFFLRSGGGDRGLIHIFQSHDVHTDLLTFIDP